MTPAACAALRQSFENSLLVEPCVSIGTRVREVRSALGWGRPELAEVLGVHPTAIKKWETEESSPGWYYLKLLSVATNMTLDMLTRRVAPTLRQVQGERQKTVTIIPVKTPRPERLLCSGSEHLPFSVPTLSGTQIYKCSLCKRVVRLRRDLKVPKHPIRLYHAPTAPKPKGEVL